MAASQVVRYTGDGYVNEKSTLYPDGTVKIKGHVNWRNNNPGNLEYGPFARENGAIGTDGRFAVFPSMEDGYAAQSTRLQTGGYKDLSLNDAIYKWAPPSENDSAGYVAYVSKYTGISPNKKMSDMTPEEIASVVNTMSKHEGMKSGTIKEGVVMDGNKSTDGTTVVDPYASGGGGDKQFASIPLCDPPVTATPESENTAKIAQVEGDGKYSDVAPVIASLEPNNPSGRYKMKRSQAIGLMIELSRITSTIEGTNLWQKCKNSSDSDCTRLQDDLASQLVRKIKVGLIEDKNEFQFLYLRWKIGITSSDVIFDTYKQSGLIQNQERIKLMDAQPWCVNDPSNGDTAKFFDNLNKYIVERGVDPKSRV